MKDIESRESAEEISIPILQLEEDEIDLWLFQWGRTPNERVSSAQICFGSITTAKMSAPRSETGLQLRAECHAEPRTVGSTPQKFRIGITSALQLAPKKNQLMGRIDSYQC